MYEGRLNIRMHNYLMNEVKMQINLYIWWITQHEHLTKLLAVHSVKQKIKWKLLNKIMEVLTFCKDMYSH